MHPRLSLRNPPAAAATRRQVANPSLRPPPPPPARSHARPASPPGAERTIAPAPRAAPPHPPAPRPKLFRSAPTAPRPADRSPGHTAVHAAHAAIPASRATSTQPAAAVPIPAHWPYAPHPPAASRACAAPPRHRHQQWRPARLDHPAHMTLRQLRAQRRHRRHRVQHIPHRAQPHHQHAQPSLRSANYCGVATDDSLTRPCACRRCSSAASAASGSRSRTVNAAASSGAVSSRRARCVFVSRTRSFSVVTKASRPLLPQPRHTASSHPDP